MFAVQTNIFLWWEAIMKIKIYAIGKVKDFYKLGVDEYIKRLSSYAQVEIVELKDESLPDRPSESEIVKAKNTECKRVLACLKDKEYLIALDLNKKEMTSEQFAEYLSNKLENNGAKISFVIGGSYGLSEELKARVNDSVSISKLTFPHQLARLVLLEQIFRAFKILNNETYHK